MNNGLRLAASTALLAFLATLSAAPAGHAATLPAGFTETEIATGLVDPTSMAIAPDGRIFVAQQGGALRVIRDGTLLTAPFLTVPVDSRGERGLLGVAFDPEFAANQWVYVYYTATTPVTHNRLSRFTAAGDRAVAGSEVVLLDLNPLSSATNHNGGSLHFGPDGKLYVAVGENANGSNSQSLGNLLGKLLRIDRDGTPPADNPFFGTAIGVNRAIWAIGLRNPFTFAFEPAGGRLLINDVGQNTFEEIDDGFPGANYGWPATEGPTSQPGFRGPIYSYTHGQGPDQGCAITGGIFYEPAAQQFPAAYRGSYFFADLCGGWIRRLDPAHGNAVNGFATGADQPIDLEVTDDGSLYYLARGSGAVFRVDFATARPPEITRQPEDLTVAAGESATFTVAASGVAPLAYRWQRDGVDLPGATSASYSLPSASAADDGALFRAVVSNAFGSDVSDTARLTVTGDAPVAQGIGLAGSYFANRDLTGPAFHRIDPGIDFTWRRAPVPGLPADRFSIRWTGQVEARVSGLHTFIAKTDDGVRLWVDGRLLINDWTSHGPKETRGTLALVAGHRYDLRMEYFDDLAGAAARLSWSAPGLAQEVIPRGQLFPYALLAAGSSTLDAGESALAARLVARGFVPVIGAASALSAADAVGKGLVLVSASAPTRFAGPRFRGTDTPLLVWGTRHLPALGLTGAVAGRDFGIVADQTSLRIAAAGHPAAAGLTGARRVTTEPSTFGWAEGSAAATAVARLCAGTACRNAGHPAILAYEAGAPMVGLAAPGRRAALYFTASTPTVLTADGVALFDAAVRWAAGVAQP